jgi:hypothetical protein
MTSLDCNKDGMLEEHHNSQAIRATFLKTPLKKYRKFLHLSIIDNIRPGVKERLSIEAKTAFLGSKKI